MKANVFRACLSLLATCAMPLRGEDLLVPQISSEWTTIAQSPDLAELTTEKQQPVDFGIWQAADGTWQLWSCVRYTKEPGKTRLFHRWESTSLTSPDWKPIGIAMQADTRLGETQGGLQAPYVIRDGDKFHLFYGDWVRICSATSADGKSFARDSNEGGSPALFAEGPEDNTRDPMVIKVGDKWHCYYTATRTIQVTEKGQPKDKRIGVVYARSSPDLKTWSKASVVASDGQAGDGLYSSECPYVVEAAPGHYYLFRTQHYGKDAETRVYHSTDPMDFGHGALNYVDALHFVTKLPVAAPEIVRHDGQWYIAALRPDLKGVQLAKLDWRPVSEVQPKLAARPEGTAFRVALYDDSGSAGKGIPCVSDQLGSLKDIELVKLDADGIRGGLKGYDAVIFTGGSGGRQANTIGLLGREQVRRFVENGGGYIGICAGAYLACDGFRWGVKVLDAKTPSPKWERGVASLKIEATPLGRDVLGYPAEQVDVTYHNGPLLEPANNPDLGDFEPLTYFRTEVANNGSPPGIMVNSPAMVRGTCGKGRVLVSSPHPEQTPGLESFAERAVRWVTGKK